MPAAFNSHDLFLLPNLSRINFGSPGQLFKPSLIGKQTSDQRIRRDVKQICDNNIFHAIILGALLAPRHIPFSYSALEYFMFMQHYVKFVSL